MNIFLAYSAEHNLGGWGGGQIVICIQLVFVAAHIFVNFEYIQIFISTLHSTAVDALCVCTP